MDAVSKVVELELMDKEMRHKVEKIIRHGCYIFINTHICAVSWPVSGVWVTCACGCSVQSCGTGAGREREDEGQGGEDYQARL